MTKTPKTNDDIQLRAGKWYSLVWDLPMPKIQKCRCYSVHDGSASFTKVSMWGWTRYLTREYHCYIFRKEKNAVKKYQHLIKRRMNEHYRAIIELKSKIKKGR